MSVFFTVPRDVWRTRIGTFLVAVDIVRADNAVLNHATRDLFLANVSGCMIKKQVVHSHNAEIAKWLSLRNLFVSTLDVQGGFAQEVFPFPTKFLVQLKDLCLRECRFFPDDQLRKVFNACSNTLCTLLMVDSTVSNLSSLSDCHRVISLRMIHCHYITDQSLLNSLKGCHALSELSIQECDNITEGVVSGLATTCPSLRRLVLKGTAEKPFSLNTLTLSLCATKSNIQELSVGGCTISKEAMTRVGAVFPSLRALHLNAPNDLVTDTEVETLAKDCPLITSLFLPRFERLTSDALCTAARAWTALKELRIPGSRISDRGVIALVEGCSLLECLNISNCIRVTDASTQAVCAQCASLRVLDVSGCASLTDHAFDTVHLLCPLRSIVATRTELSAACGRLLHTLGVQLESIACTDPAEAFVDAVAAQPSNRVLQLAVMGSSALPHESWLRLSALLPCLESLVVSHCRQLDDEVVRAFKQHSARLHTIVVTACSNVSQELIQEVSGLWKSG